MEGFSSTPTVSMAPTTSTCSVQDYEALLRFRQCLLGITLIFKIVTLVPILCHQKLHKQQYIFPINLFAADLLGILTYPISDILHATNLPNKLEIEDYIYNWSICISSSMSNASIFLVAVYQLITISIDPFGVRGIITTPRCLATCIILWILGIGLGTSYATFNDSAGLLFLLIAINFIITVATGICYLINFIAISKRNTDLTSRRREENRQILRTLGLVYGTNLLAFACIAALHVFYNASSDLENQTYCHRLPVLYSIEIIFIMNWFGNTLVYWWRLQDFRSFFQKVCSPSKFCGTILNQL